MWTSEVKSVDVDIGELSDSTCSLPQRNLARNGQAGKEAEGLHKMTSLHSHHLHFGLPLAKSTMKPQGRKLFEVP